MVGKKSTFMQSYSEPKSPPPPLFGKWAFHRSEGINPVLFVTNAVTAWIGFIRRPRYPSECPLFVRLNDARCPFRDSAVRVGGISNAGGRGEGAGFRGCRSLRG